MLVLPSHVTATPASTHMKQIPCDSNLIGYNIRVKVFGLGCSGSDVQVRIWFLRVTPA
jgi:hypothetical protein